MGTYSEALKSTSTKKPNIKQSPTNAKLPLERILKRENDTRPLNHDHTQALADSIAAIGLIQPLAVDNQGRLLAGGHRRAAIEILMQQDRKSYKKWFPQGVPVHQFDFDASEDEGLALAIEATENEKRRDYTPTEVRDLADRLKAAGYHFSDGRPKKGQKALIPSLSIIVGKSHRTLHRYLSGDDRKKTLPHGRVFSEMAPKVNRSLVKLLECEDVPDHIIKLASTLMEELSKNE